MIADELSRIPMSSSLSATLTRATAYARAQLHSEITLEHMLVALCQDPDAGLVLASNNVDVVRLEADAVRHVDGLEKHGARRQEVDPVASPDLRRILEAAAAAARGGRRREINGAIVLAAIVGDGKSLAAQLLQAQGLSFEGAIRALQRGAGAGPRPAPGVSTEDLLASARERVASRSVAPRKVGAAEPAAEAFGGEPAQELQRADEDGEPALIESRAREAQAAQKPVPQQGPPQREPEPEVAARAEPAPMAQPAREEAGPHHLDVGTAPEPGAFAGHPAAVPVPPPIPSPDGAHAPSRMPPPMPPPLPAGAPPPMPASGAPALPPHAPPPAARWPDSRMGELGRPKGVGSGSAPMRMPSTFSRQLPASGPPGPRPVARPRAEIGQLVENIPRKMRVAVPALVEVRIARADVSKVGEGLQGGGAVHRYDVTITKAMSVRLRAPDGGFFIETASPETQWIEKAPLLPTDDFASWRWHVTPRERGRKRLQLIISARTVGADGLTAETALPDQVITVRVRTNYAQAASHWMGWGLAALIGGLLARFGEGALDAGLKIAARLTSG